MLKNNKKTKFCFTTTLWELFTSKSVKTSESTIELGAYESELAAVLEMLKELEQQKKLLAIAPPLAYNTDENINQ